ncbi:MAG: DUF4013 domain-containing protein [Halodesulfurarchaeum sp.]
MLEDGLSYPMRNEPIGRLIIGGVLGFLSFLILPLFALQGYLYKVLEGTIAGEDDPPEFTEWGELLAKGIGVTVIGFVYSVVPVVLWLVVTGAFLGTGSAVGGDAGGLVAGLGALALLLFVPVLLLIYYLVPAAIANYAAEGDLLAAFAIGSITDVILSGEYLLAVLMPIVIGLLVFGVTFVLTLTVIGVVLVPFVQFYGQVAVFRMFGSAFASVKGPSGTV